MFFCGPQKTKQVGAVFLFKFFFSCIYIQILAKFNKNSAKNQSNFYHKKISTNFFFKIRQKKIENLFVIFQIFHKIGKREKKKENFHNTW